MAQKDGNDLNAPFYGNFKIDKWKDNYEHATNGWKCFYITRQGGALGNKDLFSCPQIGPQCNYRVLWKGVIHST